MAAHIVETPEPISRHRAAIPAGLAALVMRCLEKRPADRPQTADDILRELDDVSTTRGANSSVRPSVAVLPMVNTTGDPDNEHFSDGLTDELIGVFSKVDGITVTGRTSTFALKGKGLSIRAIADLLHVEHVLEGSVRRAGDRLKVRVQLVNADGGVLWSDSYDRRLEDVFAVQEEIAQAVVRALEVKLVAARGLLVRPATKDLTAYDLFLKGRYVRRGMAPEQMRQAIGYFEQAVARDLLMRARMPGSRMRTGYSSSSPADRRRRKSRAPAGMRRPRSHWTVLLRRHTGRWRRCCSAMTGTGRRPSSSFSAPFSWIRDSRRPVILYAIALMHRGRVDEAAAELDARTRGRPIACGGAPHLWSAVQLHRAAGPGNHTPQRGTCAPAGILIGARAARTRVHATRPCPLKRSPRSRWRH